MMFCQCLSKAKKQMRAPITVSVHSVPEWPIDSINTPPTYSNATIHLSQQLVDICDTDVLVGESDQDSVDHTYGAVLQKSQATLDSKCRHRRDCKQRCHEARNNWCSLQEQHRW